MKKIMLILAIILLTGCGMKDKTTMTINADKSLNLEVIKAADNDIIDAGINKGTAPNEPYTDEERWKYLEDIVIKDVEKNPNIVYEKYENGEYKGYKFLFTLSNIDDLTSDDASFNLYDFLNLSTSKLFKKEGDNYISKIMFTGFEIMENMDYDLTFSVTLPNEPILHNASSVSNDKKTLTWNLVSSKDVEIKFEFNFDEINQSQSSNFNKILLLPIVIILIIIILIIIIKFRKKDEL